ncbi:MAG: type 1 glutamine amidotransferase [Armatimonadota bacterium]|nr:type 1 glutamine amidotransferase [Armatimonadota bacterium]
MSLRLCVINGYPAPNREVLRQAGHCSADEMYVWAFRTLAPEARLDVLYLADLDVPVPDDDWIVGYDAFLWTGSNLTIYEDDPRVQRQIAFCRRIFEVGRPQWGSCWGVQLAAVAAGGEVRKNPRGREMAIARKIHLTPEGRAHPMYQGKPEVFDGFISHLDEVTRIPEGGTLLATNAHTRVQALEVRWGRGVFWATQYHPEYDLTQMTRLLVARGEALIKEGFFADRAALDHRVARMEALARDPSRKDLRWDLAIDDDLLDERIRLTELRNWVHALVLPSVGRRLERV